ncbi:hypothetical protein Angca_002568 [Angiostrongylus cantonensis]|nr:hypothetical protein Angca_002568 [Angiostrongylus cantonensis]
MLEKCRYCGCSDARMLKKCIFCAAVAYCSEEHQQFDWKRHKPVCKQIQAEMERRITLTEPTSCTAYTQTETRYATKTADPDSNSLCESLPSVSSTTEIASSPSSTSTTLCEHQLVADYPDIEIIEMVSPTRDSYGTPTRCRKRPTPSNSIVFKDHLKNLVYNTTLQDHQNMMRKRGLTLNIHQTLVLRLRYIAEYVIRSLNEFGWAVVDNFLGDSHCRFTHKEVRCLYQRGLFSAGQLMDDKNKDEYHVKDIRSDQACIYWFDGVDPRASDAVTVRLLVSMIDSVVQHFKGRLPPYDISGRSRAMIAIYPGNGTRYVKHVDNPVKDGRCITAIYYCNEDWDTNMHGGTLRLYPESSAIPMDIDPKADRLVFFWSDRRNPHEVMPVYRPRFAITIWYMDREERRRAIEQQSQKNGQAKVEQRVNKALMTMPPPVLRNGNDKVQVFPSASSVSSLTQLGASAHDEIASSYTDEGASVDAISTVALNAPSNNSSLKTTSLHSNSNDDDENYPKSVPPPDFQI